MDRVVLTYLLYLAITVPLTAWVARVLYRHGETFLIDVFDGNDKLAKAVNQLLVTGFYLLNLGYVSFFLRTDRALATGREMVEVLAMKVGGVSLVLGVVHLFNVWMFNTYRRRAVLRAQAIPPVAPNAWTAVAPQAWPSSPTAGEKPAR
jgi:hypothetical protein